MTWPLLVEPATWRDCPLWKPCAGVVPDIVTARGDALVVAVIVLVLGAGFWLWGLGREE